MPTAAKYSQIYSFTREEKKVKGGFGSKRKVVSVKDFREIAMYAEDITALKEEIEKYIVAHPDLSESTKNNLRELKVTAGAAKEEVKLLLGEPDKVTKTSTSEIWIYRINRIRAFTVFIIPVCFVHEGYYLHFKDNALLAIERHSLQQSVHQARAPGIIGTSKK